jgi:hypothetical protein
LTNQWSTEGLLFHGFGEDYVNIVKANQAAGAPVAFTMDTDCGPMCAAHTYARQGWPLVIYPLDPIDVLPPGGPVPPTFYSAYGYGIIQAINRKTSPLSRYFQGFGPTDSDTVTRQFCARLPSTPAGVLLPSVAPDALANGASAKFAPDMATQGCPEGVLDPVGKVCRFIAAGGGFSWRGELLSQAAATNTTFTKPSIYAVDAASCNQANTDRDWATVDRCALLALKDAVVTDATLQLAGPACETEADQTGGGCPLCSKPQLCSLTHPDIKTGQQWFETFYRSDNNTLPGSFWFAGGCRFDANNLADYRIVREAQIANIVGRGTVFAWNELNMYRPVVPEARTAADAAYQDNIEALFVLDEGALDANRLLANARDMQAIYAARYPAKPLLPILSCRGRGLDLGSFTADTVDDLFGPYGCKQVA